MGKRTLALLIRALRVSARDLRMHLARFGILLIVVLLLGFAVAGSLGMAAPGLTYFRWLTTANFWFITMAGASVFASTITEEREDGTLSLLKLAGLGPVSIVAGKAIPLFLGAFLFLSIQFPFTALGITLGGILWSQVVAAYLMLLAHLVLVAGVGVLISVVSRQTGVACGRAAGLWLFLIAGTWAMQRYVVGPGNTRLAQSIEAVNDAVRANFAFYRTDAVFSSTYGESPWSSQVISNLVIGSLCFVLSTLIFNPCTANEAVALGIPWWRRPLRWGSARRRAWTAAIIGKDFHQLAGGGVAILIRLFLLPLLVTLAVWAESGFQVWRIDDDDWASTSLFIALSALGIEAAIQAARVFRMETSGQTWSSLCMLPRSIPRLAESKLCGALLGLGPALLLLLVSFLLSAKPLEDFCTELFEGDGESAFILFLIAQLFLAFHVATYLSLSIRWASWPVAVVMSAFTGIMTVFLFVMFLDKVMGYHGPHVCPGTIWTSVFVSLGVILKSQFAILNQLRRAAAE